MTDDIAKTVERVVRDDLTRIIDRLEIARQGVKDALDDLDTGNIEPAFNLAAHAGVFLDTAHERLNFIEKVADIYRRMDETGHFDLIAKAAIEIREIRPNDQGRRKS